MATALQTKISKTGNATAAVATTYAVGAGANTGEVVVGVNQFVRIIATVAMNVRFGVAGTNVATANDHYLAPLIEYVWDMGRSTSLCIYAVAAGSVNVGILSRT